jgi:hypothetical protein
MVHKEITFQSGVNTLAETLSTHTPSPYENSSMKISGELPVGDCAVVLLLQMLVAIEVQIWPPLPLPLW